jgi:hypothetical protein
LQRVKYVIKELCKHRIKHLRKVLIKSHHDDAMDTDRLYEFERMLREVGLTTDVDAISSNEDESLSNAPTTDIGGSSM